MEHYPNFLDGHYVKFRTNSCPWRIGRVRRVEIYHGGTPRYDIKCADGKEWTHVEEKYVKDALDEQGRWYGPFARDVYRVSITKREMADYLVISDFNDEVFVRSRGVTHYEDVRELLEQMSCWSFEYRYDFLGVGSGWPFGRVMEIVRHWGDSPIQITDIRTDGKGIVRVASDQGQVMEFHDACIVRNLPSTCTSIEMLVRDIHDCFWLCPARSLDTECLGVSASHVDILDRDN